MIKLLIALLLLSFSGFSQQLTYRTGGNIYNANSEKLQPAAVRELMKNNQSALSLYNAGRNKKTWGNVLFYGGLGLATINLVSGLTTDTVEIDQYGNYSSRKIKPTLAIIGGVMFVASIPIKIGYTRKIKTAIKDFNQNTVLKEKVKQDISIIADGNGAGFRISF